MARPTKYDDAKAAQICTLLRGGCTRRDAYGSIGIDAKTFASWLKRFSDFSQQVESAEAFAAVKMTTVITKAAETDWRAALEFLKRRRRDDWGDSLNLTKQSDDDLLSEAAEIVAKSAINRAGEGSSDGGGETGPDADPEG